MMLEYEEARSILGLEGDFTYIQLTKAFTIKKKGVEDEDELDKIADAYDFIKRNFKKIKLSERESESVPEVNGSEANSDIFPKILTEVYPIIESVAEYPVLLDSENNPLEILMVPHFKRGKLPTISSGKYLPQQKIIFYLDKQMFVGETKLYEVDKLK